MGLSTCPLNHKGNTEELQTINTQDAGLYVYLCSCLSQGYFPTQLRVTGQRPFISAQRTPAFPGGQV